ncbi:RNA polymerase II mediator complex subunit MED27 domain-containing protein [Aspergillus lucknowensis]|uniref:NAD(P)-binding domain-containing protein n=1 Tax=Aspergillus lucknowensis TaxID=176173 RepID=A0ABR4LQU5_9EURO
MAGLKILVIGGTGPAGICLLRELVFRKHETVVFARNPSRIPEDLISHELIEVIKGELDDFDALSTAIAECRLVISLLGPNVLDKKISPTLYQDFYKSSLFPLMRQHGVRRIFAMGTISIYRPEDHWTLSRSALVLVVRLFANGPYQDIVNIAKVFESDASDLDWTVYRIAMIPGGSDEESWRKDREDGETFVGAVGANGWTISQRRGALARWLVDGVEGGAEDWMESSSSMNSNGTSDVKGNDLKDSPPATNPTVAQEESPHEPAIDPELLESEMELVSALAKLQKLEETIHQLRTLLPERLLEPLAPIVNPKGSTGNIAPNSPQKLFQQLSQAARAGVGEVGEFQAMWRSQEMKAVWERIDTLIHENAGQLLQSSGMWEQDYDTLLEDLTKQDIIRKEQSHRAREELERSQLQSVEGGWKAIVENFVQKNVPGVRVVLTKNDSSFIVLLPKGGLSLRVHTIDAGQESGIPDWKVVSKRTSAEPPSTLENAVLDCLNSRPRKWDLNFLLEMIASYSNIYETRCVKCDKMTDKAANLPVLRRLKAAQSLKEPQLPTFEAYHAACI